MHNQSFPELSVKANSLMWGLKKSFRAAVQKCMKHEAHYIIFPQAEGQMFSGCKATEPQCGFLGGHDDLHQSRIWPFVSQPIDFPNLRCRRAWFYEMRRDGKCSGLLTGGAEKRNLSEDSWHHFSRPDCWSKHRCLVVMHLHIFLPVFLLLAMYDGLFISVYSQSKFTFPPS